MNVSGTAMLMLFTVTVGLLLAVGQLVVALLLPAIWLMATGDGIEMVVEFWWLEAGLIVSISLSLRSTEKRINRNMKKR